MSSFHRADWIGFAQAIGGMLAVAAAFLVSWLQGRSAERSRRRDMLDQLDALAKTVEIAKDRASELQTQLMKAPATNGIKFADIPQIEKVDVAFAAVNGLSINSAPSAKSVGALVDAKTAIRHAVAIIPAQDSMLGRSGQFFETHQDELKRVVGLLTGAEAQIRSELSRLAGKS